MVVVAVVAAAAAWALVAPAVPAAADAADYSPPFTYKYEPPAIAGWAGLDGSKPVSMSNNALSVGWASTPGGETFAPESSSSLVHTLYYGVADQLGRGLRELRLLDAPGAVRSHPGHSHLSGDGLSFVATYRADPETLGLCNGFLYPQANYATTQVMRWERPDRQSEFGAPIVMSLADGSACNGMPADVGPPLTGIGGDGESWEPTITNDGSVVAFTSWARNFGSGNVPTTEGVKGLFISTLGSTGDPVVSMVTPADLNADVWSPMISGDGNRIVFVSNASDLVPGVSPPPFGTLVYVATRDGSSWTFDVVSKSTSGALAADGGVGVENGAPSIDDAGERVAFWSPASNLDTSVGNPAVPTAYVRDIAAGKTWAVTDRSPLDEEDHPASAYLGATGRAAISHDGERVAAFGVTGFDDPSLLRVFDADDVVSGVATQRRWAMISDRDYAPMVNSDLNVVIEGQPASPPTTPASYAVAFPSYKAPTPFFGAYGSAIYFVGGGSLGPDIARGWHGDPVDTANGSFRQDEVDLVAPGEAGPAAVRRTHTSIGEPSGVFGPGWMSNLDERLQVRSDVALLTMANGQRVAFVDEDMTGEWQPIEGLQLTMLDTEYGWSVTDATGAERRFGPDGRLIGWSEPERPAVTVEWGAMAPESMSTDTGHEVVFDDWSQSPVYDGTGQIVDWIIDEETPDGLIDRATSSDGRRVDYGYERGFEDLLVLDRVSRPHAVGQPAGTYGTRHYEMVGPRIARIIDEVDATRTEVVVENSYDELGRVTHQVNETGDELDFAYGQKPDPFGVLVDAVGFTTVTNAASGDVTVYEYNDRGEVVAVTDAAGNSVSRSWATDRPESATSREGVDTDHAYDDAGRVVAVTETAGATTRTIETTTYVTPDTSPAARTDDRVATRTDEAGVTTTFTYAGASRDPETMSVPCDPASTDASTPCPPSGLSTTTYTYAAPGLVASVTDPDGVVTEYTYAADRSMATMTTYDGTTPLVTTYTTVRAGDPGWTETNPAAVEVRTTETPGGAVTSEVFDAEGRLVETRDPLYDGTTHLATVYSYRLNGELATVTDPAGGTTTSSVARPGDPGWAEDPEIAEVRTVTGADGVSSISKIDLSGDVVVEQRGDPAVPAELATTTFEYGPLGRLESTTDPMGVTTTYEHDAEGRVTAVVDEDGERTETDHDAFGRVSVETDPLGETRTTTYGPSDRIASVTDRNGEVTSYAYDDAGRVMAVTDARGGVWETTFTRAGRVASETDATDRTTQYRYDTAGRRVEAELPSGDTTTTDYDEDGRVASVTSPEGRVTTATYDDLGRTLTVADPMRGTTVTTYHPTGEVATQTDASGAQVELTYDGAGRVLTVTDPLDRVTTYGYDSRGNRTSRTDARSGVQHWEYDLADRPTKEIDQLGRAAATLTYDDLGRVATRKDGAARTETLTYDEAGQVISSQFGNVPTTYTYDGEGRRTSVTASAGTTTWTYDEVGNVTAIDELGPRDVSWTWDLAGRRVEMTLPNGVRQRNVYDDDGAHAGVERWNGSSWIDSVALTLDDDGLVVGRTVEGGMSATWDRDPSSGRVDAYTEVLGGVTTATDLTHDAVGRVLTETTAAGTTTYGYDAAGQLTGADRPGTADDETFAYDELGRRTTSTQGGTTTTYAWDAASQLTSRTIGGTAHTYTYDGSGRRTLESWNGGASYRQWAWTSRGELGTIKHVTPAGTDETRRYLRGDGRLLSTTTIPATGTQWTTTYAWDTSQGLPRVIGLRTGTNVVTPTYAAGLARVQCNSTSLDCQGPVAHDGLGSAVATPDTDDAITGDEYTAFGDPGAAARGHTLGYRGELHYGGAIHLRARDYDPDTGLFVGPDLLDGVDGTPTVANPYHYADNDPVNKVDPTGLRPTDGYHTTCSVLSVVEGLFGRSGEAIVTDLARSQTNPQRCVPRLEALAECFDSGGDAVDWDQSSYSGGLRCGDWVKDCSAANWKFACDHGAVLVKGGWVVFGASTIVFTVFAGGNPMWAGCGAGAIGGALFAGDDVDEINAAAVGGCITGAAAASGNVAVGCAGGFIGSGVVSTGFDVDPVQGGLGCLYAAGSAAVGTAPTWPFDKPPMFVVSKAWERGIQCALGALSGATSGTDIPDRLLRGLFGCAGGIFLAWKDAS